MHSSSYSIEMPLHRELFEVRTLQDKYIVFLANRSMFFSGILSFGFCFPPDNAFLRCSSISESRFLSAWPFQLTGSNCFCNKSLGFSTSSYLQGFSLTLLKVAEGQSEPLVLNTKSHNVQKTYFTISICRRRKLTRKFFFSNFHVTLKSISIWKHIIKL